MLNDPVAYGKVMDQDTAVTSEYSGAVYNYNIIACPNIMFELHNYSKQTDYHTISQYYFYTQFTSYRKGVGGHRVRQGRKCVN